MCWSPGAGFIGSHLVDSLLRDGFRVTVIDNFDPFYDRVTQARQHRPRTATTPSWQLVEGDIRDASRCWSIAAGDIDVVVHLAAAAGVRPSIAEPVRYQESQRRRYAEPAGVCAGTRYPAVRVRLVEQRVRRQSAGAVVGRRQYCRSVHTPARRSAASCWATYAHLHGIQFIALRLFTVYGPRSGLISPLNKFTKLMLAGQPIPLFGDGSTRRDYTYVGDIVAGLRAAIELRPHPASRSSTWETTTPSA